MPPFDSYWQNVTTLVRQDTRVEVPLAYKDRVSEGETDHSRAEKTSLESGFLEYGIVWKRKSIDHLHTDSVGRRDSNPAGVFESCWPERRSSG